MIEPERIHSITCARNVRLIRENLNFVIFEKRGIMMNGPNKLIARILQISLSCLKSGYQNDGPYNTKIPEAHHFPSLYITATHAAVTVGRE